MPPKLRCGGRLREQVEEPESEGSEEQRRTEDPWSVEQQSAVEDPPGEGDHDEPDSAPIASARERSIGAGVASLPSSPSAGTNSASAM